MKPDYSTIPLTLIEPTAASVPFTKIEPTYECPKHGITPWLSVVTSGRDLGVWCIDCLCEHLDAVGVPRMTKIRKEED